MEDMARLALVEQSVRDVDTFSKILYELLHHISHILENPHDYDLRTIRSNILKDVLKHDSFSDYLKYLGFKTVNNDFIYPKELTLSNLRMAQFAIERKINFCYGSLNNSRMSVGSSHNRSLDTKNELTPVQVLTTNNELLKKIEMLFNNMLVYEDEELQSLAREHIPLVTLQLMALDRMREQQKKIKTGEIKGHDLSFDIALLMELMGWFKHKYFSWVDQPPCEICGGPTKYVKSTSMKINDETCRVEMYKCSRCPVGVTRFPRHNSPRALLRTRRGRCGEWANCFALFCRALGYDTRYVYDTTDHVWCEIFDYDSNTWLHADPCEAKLNAPLLYSHGWKKKLSYVIALSRDDLQDVTWRYTMNHKEVLKRRTQCTESELIWCIMTLREHRQRQVSEARRKYLTKRALEELVQLMVEKQPSDFESHGRISGSKQWRMERGEAGSTAEGHVFEFPRPGTYCARYHPGPDHYRLTRDGEESQLIRSWAAAAHQHNNIFRKVENDWHKVYLAREDGETMGQISWKLVTSDARLQCTRLRISAASAVYENGDVTWTLSFDEGEPVPVTLTETPTTFDRKFKSVEIVANLSGGVGEVSWQHAQLFRQDSDDAACAFEVTAVVESEP
ncbi:hypothetical protein O3G_MSEX010152 [Manduca sexta]|uniref:Peptide-N(4)-(N-acetyl-beta-glucosaminyl)asparagine amidase n=1 Tax=Manduca sexta TaxID=7130 RepID=A0A922CSY0_MANSE|nr:hypothetical protein O3G_MSEX010152 [Manduca sexta]